MPANLSTLTALAQAATPGPWECSGDSRERSSNYPTYEITTEANAHSGSHRQMLVRRREDAAFIAACSPDVILALVARVNELEAALKTYGQHLDMCQSSSVPSVPSPIPKLKPFCTCGLTTALRGPSDG